MILCYYAGYSPTELRGSQTGVFCSALGGEATDYGLFNFNADTFSYSRLGTFSYMIPAKIAFALDLQGPSALLSTACSSSLTAMEAAVNGILLGKFEAAIVTGSNLCLNPRHHLAYMTGAALAKDGRCKAFDESGKCEWNICSNIHNTQEL